MAQYNKGWLFGIKITNQLVDNPGLILLGCEPPGGWGYGDPGIQRYRDHMVERSMELAPHNPQRKFTTELSRIFLVTFQLPESTNSKPPACVLPIAVTIERNTGTV